MRRLDETAKGLRAAAFETSQKFEVVACGGGFGGSDSQSHRLACGTRGWCLQGGGAWAMVLR